MSKSETIQEFYQQKYHFIPDNLRKEIGHFNVFKLAPFVGKNAKPTPYRRRDYYKIMLVNGSGIFHYADKEITVQKHALVFSDPQIPYSWARRDEITSGYFCIFDQAFFHQYGSPAQYPLFQPDGNHVFEITDEQSTFVTTLYERMFAEISSDYLHKFDVLRTITYELMHFALKMQPPGELIRHPQNAAQRISTLFLELLERQFPIDDPRQTLALRSASEYAGKLNVHVNHLNRAIKETTDKTTTQIISERVLQEARVLLKQTTWTVSEIAYALGHTEVSHFNNFFKKNMDQSPLQFRNV